MKADKSQGQALGARAAGLQPFLHQPSRAPHGVTAQGLGRQLGPRQRQQQQHRGTLLPVRSSGNPASGSDDAPKTIDELFKVVFALDNTVKTFMGSTVENLIRETVNRVLGAEYSTPLLLQDVESAVDFLHNALPHTDKALLQARVIKLALEPANVKQTLSLLLARIASEIEGPSTELATSLAAARDEVSAWDCGQKLGKLDDLVKQLFIRDQQMPDAKDQIQYMRTTMGQMLIGLKNLVVALGQGRDAATEVLMVKSSNLNPCMLLLSTAALETNGGGEKCLGQAVVELDMAGSAFFEVISKAVVVEAAEIKASSGSVEQVVLRARIMGGLLVLVADSEKLPWQQKLKGVVYKPRSARSPTYSAMRTPSVSPFPLESTAVVGEVKVYTVLV